MCLNIWVQLAMHLLTWWMSFSPLRYVACRCVVTGRFFYLCSEHRSCHGMSWRTKAAVLSMIVKETPAICMYKQPGSFVNILVVGSTVFRLLEAVAPSRCTEFTITHFPKAKFSGFYYLFLGFPTDHFRKVLHIKCWVDYFVCRHAAYGARTLRSRVRTSLVKWL
jgi:hypothetical protein